METKRTAILDATLALVTELGFHGTAVSAIAERSGVGVGTIYRHFKNKDNLIIQLFVELRRESYKAWLKGFTGKLSLWERFCLLWNNAMDYYLANPQTLSFMEQFIASPYMNNAVMQEYANHYEPVEQFYQDGVREGVFKDMPELMRYHFTVGTIGWLAKHHISGNLVLDQASNDIAIKASWDALTR